MRTLNEHEIQAVTGGAIYEPTYKEIVETGGLVLGAKAPTLLKAVVGAVVTPFILLIYAVTLGQIG